MPVMIWLRATNRVALPRVQSQLTFGILRRKIASQALRQPRRSSSQSPIRFMISGSLDVELAGFDLDRIGVKGSRRRTGDDLTLLIEDAVMARAEEPLFPLDPAHPAAEMGADVRQGDVGPPVVRQNVHGQLFVVDDPAGLTAKLGPEQGGDPGLDFRDGPEGNPLLG